MLTGRTGLVIMFKEHSVLGFPGSVRVFPALMDGDEVVLDLCEDGVVVMGKQEFRRLAKMQEEEKIGNGKLVWLLGDVQLVRESDDG